MTQLGRGVASQNISKSGKTLTNGQSAVIDSVNSQDNYLSAYCNSIPVFYAAAAPPPPPNYATNTYPQKLDIHTKK